MIHQNTYDTTYDTPPVNNTCIIVSLVLDSYIGCLCCYRDSLVPQHWPEATWHVVVAVEEERNQLQQKDQQDGMGAPTRYHW